MNTDCNSSSYRILQSDASVSLDDFQVQCSILVDSGYTPCTTLYVNGYIVQSFYLNKNVSYVHPSTKSCNKRRIDEVHEIVNHDFVEEDTEEDEETYEPIHKKCRKDKIQEWQRMMYS
jgi:hypothetical protein